MSQYDYGAIDPASHSGTDLAGFLNNHKAAVHSTHKGAARPSYVVAGMLWVKETAPDPTLMYFDGTNDITVTIIVSADGGKSPNAEKLNGQLASFYQNASNLNAGTIPSARLNATDLLNQIKTVHGAGSGLDADKLDGLNSSQFLRSDQDSTLSGRLILGPQGAEGGEMRFQPGTGSTLGGSIVQDQWQNMVRLYEGTATPKGFRFDFDQLGAGEWATVWHSGNDGAGGGLDADLLDGQEGSFYRNAGNLNAGTVNIARLPEATAAQFRNNTADKLLSTDQVYSAMAEVALSDAATISWDMNTGFDFAVTLAGNRTLANPTNIKVGKRGRLRVAQDATGSRTLGWGSYYKFAAGEAPTLSTAAGAVDVLYYDCRSATEIYVSPILDVK